MTDDVPEEEKLRRFRLLEELQEGIATQINARYLGQTVESYLKKKSKSAGKGARRPINWSLPHPLKTCADRCVR